MWAWELYWFPVSYSLDLFLVVYCHRWEALLSCPLLLSCSVSFRFTAMEPDNHRLKPKPALTFAPLKWFAWEFCHSDGKLLQNCFSVSQWDDIEDERILRPNTSISLTISRFCGVLYTNIWIHLVFVIILQRSYYYYSPFWEKGRLREVGTLD